uniref:Uncharacterized protein n=1 Tax=Parascaris equorum TaxID=6256 RepID=A0A914SIZ0_PAREQ
MSVIVRNTSGDITLYCKGADTMIMESLGRFLNSQHQYVCSKRFYAVASYYGKLNRAIMTFVE